MSSSALRAWGTFPLVVDLLAACSMEIVCCADRVGV